MKTRERKLKNNNQKLKNKLEKVVGNSGSDEEDDHSVVEEDQD
jgi:hypothetical protein